MANPRSICGQLFPAILRPASSRSSHSIAKSKCWQLHGSGHPRLFSASYSQQRSRNLRPSLVPQILAATALVGVGAALGWSIAPDGSSPSSSRGPHYADKDHMLIVRNLHIPQDKSTQANENYGRPPAQSRTSLGRTLSAWMKMMSKPMATPTGRLPTLQADR